MTCRKCEHGIAKKFGKTAAGTGRYRCKDCGATFTEAKPASPLGAHTTSIEDAEHVFMLMTEGMSVRAIARVTGIHKTTILSLLVTLGAKGESLLESKLVDVRPNHVEADEAWTFVQKKQKRLRHDDPDERGDQYVWLALDADRKLILAHHVGKRDHVNAYEFVNVMGRRIATAHRFQLTTDGLEGSYPNGRIVLAGSYSGTDFSDALVRWMRAVNRLNDLLPVPVLTIDPLHLRAAHDGQHEAQVGHRLGELVCVGDSCAVDNQFCKNRGGLLGHNHPMQMVRVCQWRDDRIHRR